MEYSVKKLASLAGVSVRTLHHYDRIGLLKPAHRTEAGYRIYGSHELLRLQQILFYRELDMPLEQIRDILDDPDFDMLHALHEHKKALQARKKRVVQLLSTLDKTIVKLKKGNEMKNPEELYEGLPKEKARAYRKEAVKKYGAETIDRSESHLMGLGKAGFEELKRESAANYDRLFALRSEDHTSDKVQKEIHMHYGFTRQFWGKLPQKEAYTGLGDLYTQDERFITREGKPHPEFAAFLYRAIKHYANTKL